MNRLTLIKYLNARLLKEMPQLEVEDVSDDLTSQRKLLRALMNVRPPMPLDKNLLHLQDELLSAEVVERGIVKISDIPDVEPHIKIWRGDITRLAVDAIVNAANETLLGCFVPLHGCIDNAIHSAAGLQLRDACQKIMEAQGHDEPTGSAKITPAFNLPSKFILHTVGPIIPPERDPTPAEENQLAACYESCLKLAAENNLQSVAFCCISTGEFHFPNRRAAQIAISTVKKFLAAHELEVVFNVFKELDEKIYREVLSKR
ncbi:MAG: protein-ADP-ribose hydrolase [Selenomonadaceae bacterium]|nr:protein-ADP-ribose hydrolase [Selenomonadaceae bacterium]